MEYQSGIKNICVVSSNSHAGFALGVAAVDALKELGFNVCASERIEDCIKSDAVLIISGLRYPNLHLESLGKFRDRRPKVIIWQIDPVPPPEFTKEAERTGVLIQKFNKNSPLRGTNGKLFQFFFSVSRMFFKSAKWLLSIKLERQLRRIDEYGMLPSEGSEWSRLIERYLAFKKYIDQGLIDYNFTSSIAREKFFKSRGINTIFIPLGYHHQFGRMLNMRRDIDVLFLGRINNKRRKILIRNIAHSLKENSISFIIIDNAYGDARTKILNRAKIVLDIPRVPWETGGIRFLMAMSCGALVVSSNVKYTAPYEPDVHFAGCGEQNIVDSVRYYLSNNVQRQKLVDNAYNFVTKNITATNMMSKVMEVCNAHPAFQDGC